jgi:predicted adenylyl cyclase CyaB
MPTNLELKFAIPSLPRAEQIAHSAGAVGPTELLQVDTYFNVTNGRMKLRVIGGSAAELITYVRPEDHDERLSEYHKTPIAEPTEFRSMLLASLGLLVEVKKRRVLYMMDTTRVHLDEVEGLGSFGEFEIPFTNESDTGKRMRELRDIFNVRDADICRHSYSDMLLARHSRHRS